MTKEIETLRSRIESLKCQRDEALLYSQVRHAAVCEQEIEKARQCLEAVEAERYERWGYDAA